MVAELAREDYEDMVADGLRPTLDDFDRLNQLALRLEAGSETTPANYPRIGWAGDVPFYEPTAAAIMWMQDYAVRAAGDAETRRTFYYFALAHGRQPESFQGLETPQQIGRAVKDWLRRVGVTEDEMARACHYAAFGFDDAEAAVTPMRKEYLKRRNKTAAVENLEQLEKLVVDASVASGMSYSELMACTTTRLNAMVVAAQVEAGLRVSRDLARLQVEYTATVNEIRERLEKEQNDGK